MDEGLLLSKCCVNGQTFLVEVQNFYDLAILIQLFILLIIKEVPRIEHQ